MTLATDKDWRTRFAEMDAQLQETQALLDEFNSPDKEPAQTKPPALVATWAIALAGAAGVGFALGWLVGALG